MQLKHLTQQCLVHFKALFLQLLLILGLLQQQQLLSLFLLLLYSFTFNLYLLSAYCKIHIVLIPGVEKQTKKKISYVLPDLISSPLPRETDVMIVSKIIQSISGERKYEVVLPFCRSVSLHLAQTLAISPILKKPSSLYLHFSVPSVFN